ncbi:hypothetical protein LP419_08080 [Massilia sp. H-1]|nr:hypothetical protein LP419_08080 [Massilia sp. H-1]
MIHRNRSRFKISPLSLVDARQMNDWVKYRKIFWILLFVESILLLLLEQAGLKHLHMTEFGASGSADNSGEHREHEASLSDRVLDWTCRDVQR